jgi:hypothetical protein
MFEELGGCPWVSAEEDAKTIGSSQINASVM